MLDYQLHNMNVQHWTTTWAGRTLTLETGRYAHQTTAAVTARYGDTVILATVVKSKQTKDELDFFPLSVSFEEKLYAAGKIKGSRFIKREGRPSDESILTSRIVDRAIRPLFNQSLRNEVQVVLTALTVDGENDAAMTAMVAASAALSISGIEWHGPIGGARIGLDENGEFILNVTRTELETNGALDLFVAGTPEKLVMVEAGASEVTEDVMFKAMKWGCEQMQPAIDLINTMKKDLGVTTAVVDAEVSEEQAAKNDALAKAKAFVDSKADAMVFDKVRVGKAERVAMVEAIKEATKDHLLESGIEEEYVYAALAQIKGFVGQVVSQGIIDNEKRIDGRSLTDIRQLTSEIDVLPRVHGTGFFQRGDTQVLSIVTLGAPGDVQTLDTMEEEGTKRYMHHYNDGPYTYGETGFMRGPGRRAIGHGALAERALEPVLPKEEDFPYAIRVVSEVFGSNGSSSMASTCGSTLSLMAAGVPIQKAVAGIAMGLASNDQGQWKVITDLQDIEDGPGGMDFKITGTKDGITAMQMDTKTHGLTWDIVEQTVHQSQKARMEVLANMQACIATPKAELSPYAPRIETIQINPEKIGDVIGPGGKTIKKIIEDTGVNIDIEQDGRVLITSADGEAMEKARHHIEMLTKEVEAGEEYEGKVVRIEDFGAFVEILPGKDGLVHVSEIAWERVNKPGDVLTLNDMVKVKVKEIDNLGRVNLSMKALKPKPEGFVEQPKTRPMHGRPPRRDNDRRPRTDRRAKQ